MSQPQEPLRTWFVPGEGIDRRVISADIQRYLGRDATVRPGMGSGKDQGVEGYWIRAYRDLTTAMIADLRADSARWRQEQSQTGTRGSYENSSTFYNANAREAHRGGTGSPSMMDQSPYGLPPTQRTQGQGPYDNPRLQQPTGYDGYPPQRNYGEGNRYAPPDNFPQYPQEQANPPGGMNRAPPPPQYNQDPRYQSNYPQNNDGAPPGMRRQGNYYVPVSAAPGYDPSSNMPMGADRYGQPGQPRYAPPPQGRNEPGRYPPQDFAANNYPSPAATISSVSGPPLREPISSPQQQSMYGNQPAPYDMPYDRPPGTSGGSDRRRR